MKYIIAYPPVDFSVPFEKLRPEEIDIYFHYDSRIGKPTCKAACAHCYFRNRPTFHIPAERALAITHSLREQGYNIGLAPADSFGDEALEAGDAGSAFRLKAIGTSAWTSGMPLYLPGWETRLDRAWEIGFQSIIVTAHEAAGTLVPIRGVTRAPVIQGAIRNIREWNRRDGEKHFSISTTFTVRRDNCRLDLLRQMVRWGVVEGIDLVRFNCFANFQRLPEHERFEMSKDDIIRFFGYLSILQEEFYDTPTSLGISEDWGDAGIEKIYSHLPPVWQKRTAGWCRAGYRLFAMIEVDGEVVVTGCVDKWEPILGKVLETEPNRYTIQWEYSGIEAIRQAVLQNQVYACWGGVGCERPPETGFGTELAAERSIFK